MRKEKEQRYMVFLLKYLYTEKGCTIFMIGRRTPLEPRPYEGLIKVNAFSALTGRIATIGRALSTDVYVILPENLALTPPKELRDPFSCMFIHRNLLIAENAAPIQKSAIGICGEQRINPEKDQITMGKELFQNSSLFSDTMEKSTAFFLHTGKAGEPGRIHIK